MLRFILLAIIQLWLIQNTVGVVPQIQRLNVQCDRTGMKVNVDFDIPFNGIIFSKGHYSDPNCRYVSPASLRNSYNFFIPSTLCGTIQTDARRDGTVGFKNIIIIQNDPEYQEVWDMARKISCDWVTRIDKYVTFAPFGVDMLGVKEIAFPGDTVDCWMDIQRGHGPFAPTIAGVVPIGEKLTIVIYIRDKDSSFDIHVKDCYAYDTPDYKNPNARAIQLTDVRGCPIKEKLVKGFYRTRDVRNSGATIIAYGVINAFKFPEAMDVFLACNVEVCKGGCENPCQPEVSSAGGDADTQQQIDGQVPDSQRRVDPDDDDGSSETPTTTMRNDVDTDEAPAGGDTDAAGGETEGAGGETDSGATDGGATDSGATDSGASSGTDSSGGETDSAGGSTETEGTSGGETDTSSETEDAGNTDTETSSEASNGATEAPATEAPAADSGESNDEEEEGRAASSPVRAAIKTRAKKSNLRSSRLKAPPKPSPKANLKTRSKSAAKAAPKAALKARPKTSAKLRANTNTNSRKRKRQQSGRGKRGKRSIIITGLNGTFPEMTHSISIISPVEDFDENELEIWQRAKEADNKVCFSALSLITSSLILTGLSILFSVSLLLSYGRLRQRNLEKSFS